jgi:hypothetical protein
VPKTFKIRLHFVLMWLNYHLCTLVGWAIIDIPQFSCFSYGAKKVVLLGNGQCPKSLLISQSILTHPQAP